MDKKSRNIGILLSIVVLLLIGAAALLSVNNPSKIVNAPTPTIVSEKKPESESVMYQGQNGQDALTLLKKQANVETNSSGLVTKINDKVASDKNKEFWAFYVNGKMAEVGPAEYVTKDTEKIEWKVEKY